MKYPMLCAALMAAPLNALAEVPLQVFAQRDDFTSVKISPDGRYVAALVPDKDVLELAVVPVAAPEKTLKLTAGANTGIIDYSWAGPDRLIAELSYDEGVIDSPLPTGELIGMNADGSNSAYLFGFRGDKDIGTHLQHVDASGGFANIIATPFSDPRHALISVLWWDNSSPDSAVVDTYKINVFNGLLDNKHSAPIAGYTSFLGDRGGNVRYAVGWGPHEQLLTFSRTVDGDWHAVNSGELKSAKVIPLAFSPDGDKAYLRSDEGGSRACLVEHSLLNGQRRKLSCDEVADLDHIVLSFDRKGPIAAVYTADKPSMRLLDSDHPDRAKLEALQSAFPGQIAEPVSTTADGSKALVLVYSDRNPGDYYVFDTATMKAAYLLSRRGAVDPEQMAERRPISFKARDGQVLHGYLTLPPGKEPKNLPLVVNPHGGPFWIRDEWRWDPEPEMLASRGYAVLQVNYRGSGGFGENFVQAGRQKWDSVMIDDITDSARWAVAQGIADGKRMCIYGASYGGYAALMSAVREPALYRCVVDYAGVYDLAIQRSSSDLARSKVGRNYIDDFIGATPERLAQASPAAYIDKLQAAIMIVHGEEDERVPLKQAKALRAALDQRHYPYEWLVKPGEMHGFAEPKNRLELYTRLLAFLDKNIGPGAAAPTTTTVAAPPPATPAEGLAHAAAKQ